MDFPYLHYSVYKTCHLQYKWRFVQRPDVYIPINLRHAYIGLVLQKLVERFYLEKWWQAEEGPITRMRIALPTVSQLILENNPIKLSVDELADWQVVANETIPRIIATIKKEKLLSSEVYVEREEEVPFGEDTLQMKPDLILIRKGITTLLDGKGGKTVGRYVDNDQPYFYAIAVDHIWGRLPHRIGFWWYRHSKIVWLPVTREAVDQVRTNARSFIDGIKAGKFDPVPGQHCRLCDYRVCCEVGQKFIAERHRQSDVEIPGNFSEVDFG
jgi:hypothetical protein